MSVQPSGPPSASAAGQALPVGTVLNEFEVTGQLGEGGFSIVYRAIDRSLQRTVVLKEYLPVTLAVRGDALRVQVRGEQHQEAFAAGLKSFINEARLLAQFDHPSLLKVYRFWEANGTAYMVMPLYEGPNLRSALRARGEPPDEAWLRALVEPLGRALQVLHAESVYHRDIAPDNILLQGGSERRPVLLDFGAARRVIGDLTQTLTVILKPAYAPLEQYAEVPGLRQGPWTDVYSLAAVLHFAITGKTPPPAVGRAMEDSYVPLVQAAAGRYSEPFLSAIDRALAVRPEQRTPSVGHFLADLGLAQRAVLPDPFASTSLPAPPERATQITASPTGPASDPAAEGRTVLRPLPSGPALPLPEPPALSFEDRTTFVGAGKAAGVAGTAGAAGSAEVRLVITASDQAGLVGTSVRLRGERLEIGRDATADLRLADAACSRRHAAVLRQAGGFRLVDLGSTNATHLNGRALQAGREEALLFGAQVRIGQTTMLFLPAGEAEAADDSGSELAGRYVLRERLRASPKSAVYRATLKGSDLPVAIKLLAAEAAAMHEYQAQFQREAALAQRLRHPHICELRDYGRGTLGGPGRPGREVNYLCYSLLQGGDLAGRLARSDQWPPAEQALRWLGNIAEALHYAHGHGVVHGNLKPSAVCFDSDGHAYVTDFASAVTAEGGAGALLGAPAYMAPEQWAGQPAQAGTDQFALAVLAYTLLTGRRPFEGQEDPAQRERNFRRGPEPAHEEAASAGRPPLPVALSPVLHRALAAEPARRFDNVEQFAAALTEAWQKRHDPRRAGGAAAPPVFISYQRDKSAGWAVLIQRELADKHGIKSFVDAQRLDGAQRFPERIANAIRDCEVFVCLLAGSTLKSRWVREEIRLAHDAGRPMIPVFQESFKKHTAPADDPAIAALLQYDGLDLLDQRNVFVHHTLADLARLVRETLGQSAAAGGADGANA